MITIKELQTKREWESFLCTHAPQSLFQSWNWGETIIQARAKTAAGQQRLWRLGLYEGKQLIGIAQGEKIVARRGTFFHVRHGPILSDWEEPLAGEVLSALKLFARNQSASFLRISPLIAATPAHASLLSSCGFMDAPMHAMDGEYCWILDIRPSEVALLSGMRKTTRYLIRQAEKMGVTIKKSTDSADLPAFLSLYQQTAQRQHFVPHKGMEEEFTQFRKDDQIELFLGYHNGQLLSGALIIFYNDQAIYHHSASIDQKIPVNYLLQWEAIKEAKKRQLSWHNFWGIAPDDKPGHPWKGLSLFKKGFGGEPRAYLHAQDYPLDARYWLIYGLERFRRMAKGY